MREYGIVTPQFWIGSTGKALRGDAQAQVVALYLMTSPHANMIGVYYCPLDYIAKETGLTQEGASKALARLIEGEFCRVDGVTEEVFVMRMAAYQIGEQLSPKDKRCIGIARELEKVSSTELQKGFRAIYSVAFHLPKVGGKLSPSKAPSKPEAGSGAGTGSEDLLPGFARFWDAWPKSDRKEARGKCHEVWVKAKAEPHADRIVAHVERLKASRAWTKDDGEFIPAPLVYLNQRKWEGAEVTATGKCPEWCSAAGFLSVHEAGNAGCYEHTASQFSEGKRLEEV